MTEPEKCPVCGSVRTLERVQCHCGYSYASGFVEPLPVAESASPRPGGAPIRRSSESAGDGSLIGGILLGFICGCFGPLIAHLGKMGPETRRGSWIGFGIGLVSGMAMRFFAAEPR